MLDEPGGHFQNIPTPMTLRKTHGDLYRGCSGGVLLEGLANTCGPDRQSLHCGRYCIPGWRWIISWIQNEMIADSNGCNKEKNQPRQLERGTCGRGDVRPGMPRHQKRRELCETEAQGVRPCACPIRRRETDSEEAGAGILGYSGPGGLQYRIWI